jgi:hypothetical protein
MAKLAQQIAWPTLTQAKHRAARDGTPILLDFSAAPT